MNAVDRFSENLFVQRVDHQTEVARAEGAGTLCDLIERICQAVATCFTYIFCCQPSENVALNHNQLPAERVAQVVQISVPTDSSHAEQVNQPSMNPLILPVDQVVEETLQTSVTAIPSNPEKVDRVAQEAIRQIASCYAPYLQYPIEVTIKECGFDDLKTTPRPLSTYLVGRYTWSYYDMANTVMRDSSEKATGASFSILGAKVYIAYLQREIENSLDRITANGDAKNCAVYRNAMFPTQFIESYLNTEKIKNGILLSNKSFLSTSSRKTHFNPEGTARSSKELFKTCSKVCMCIRLQPDTPIFDVLKHISVDDLPDPDEYEILLPAGRAFKVVAYDHSTRYLDLEEVSSDAPYEIFDSSVL